jgi:hypothetical protein
MRRLRSLLVAATLALSWQASALTIEMDADLLKDANGAPMPVTGLVLLVASTNDATFNAPTPLSFVSGDDIILGKLDLTAFGEPGVLAADQIITSVPLSSSNPIRLYWFPTLNINSTAPGQGTPYGTYTDAVGIDGSAPWFGASGNFTISFKFLTSDSNPGYHDPGSNPPSAGIASLKTETPIVINNQPANSTQNLGGTATFAVDASGASLDYQWLKNGMTLNDGAKVTGATSSALTLANVSASDVASYSVVITNSQGFVTSSSATLTVIDPYIAAQPSSVTANAGSSANFTVTANGSGSLTYQWKKAGVNLTDGSQVSGSVVSGATTAALTVSGAQQGDAGDYTVVVSGSSTTTSSTATLTITDVAPSFTNPTVATTNTLNAGDQIILTAAATGTMPVTYQWKKGASNLSDGSYANGATISGAGTGSLTLSGVLAADAGVYQCYAQNSSGNTPSPSTTIVVNDPVITVQPASFTADCNATWGCLSVTAVGSTNLTYQWFAGATPLINETNATLCFVDNSFASAGAYSVVVSNGFGNAITSSVVTITVTDTNAPVVTLTDGTPINLCKGDTYNEPGASASDLCDGSLSAIPIGSVNTSVVGSYTITYTATDSHNNVGTAFRVVNVQDCSAADPSFTLQPSSQIVVIGQKNVALQSAASGTPALRYQWFKKAFDSAQASPMKGKITPTLTIATIAATDQANYYCVVTNGLGATATSSSAALTVYMKPGVSGPGNVTKTAGNIAVFKATATPAIATDPAKGGPFTFQWTRNGTPISSGGNSSIAISGRVTTLTITNVQSSDQAVYLCVVGNLSANTAVAPNDGHHGVLSVLADSKHPTVTLLHPSSNLHFTNGLPVSMGGNPPKFQDNNAPELDLDGKAADNGIITNVNLVRLQDNATYSSPFVYRVNGAGVTLPGSVLWTNHVTLLDGTNTFVAHAQDSAGIEAPVSTRTYFMCTPATVTINVDGVGKINGFTSAFGKTAAGVNTLFNQIGYKVSAAKTVSSKQFIGWHTNDSPVISSLPTFYFVATNDLIITAEFQH